MPSFPFSQDLTANQLGFDPLTNWQLKTIPYQWARGAAVQILIRATDVNTRMQVQTGTTVVQQRSPIQGGGTAGTTPSVLNTSPLTFIASPGDVLGISIDEVAGGTPTVDGVVTVEPM